MDEKEFVRYWMNPGVISTTRDEDIYSVARAMRDLHIGCLIVVDEGDVPMGIITTKDIINIVVAENIFPGDIKVDKVMSSNLVIASVNDSMVDAAHKMTTSSVRELPIVGDDKKLIGILTAIDICKYCAAKKVERT